MRDPETRRRLPLGALVLLLAAGCLPSCGRPDPPSVVILSVDTLNRSALRAYEPGAAPLPALDAFAAESLRFDQALTTAAWTLPAHASLLTGLYPDRHGATHFRVKLADDVATLAGRLRDRGYDTVGFTDGGFMTWVFGFERGFDRYDALGPESGGPELPRQGRPAPVPGSALFDRAVAWVEARPADAPPLFLFLHTFSVHDYFNLRRWAREAVPEAAFLPDARSLQLCITGSLPCEPSTWAMLEAVYAAELQHLDAGFARLRAALEAAGLWERSVVFLLTDHGEGFDFERGRIHHGGRLHADLIRIPLLVRVPGQAPRATQAPVSLVDVMPTVLELAGAPPVRGLDGRSFAGVLRGGTGTRRDEPLFAMEHMYVWNDAGRVRPMEPPARPFATAIVDGAGWYVHARGKEELYAPSDPEQRRDLGSDPASAEALVRYREALATRPKRRRETERTRYDQALKDQLEALGYATD